VLKNTDFTGDDGGTEFINKFLLRKLRLSAGYFVFFRRLEPLF
jgi:hypothetical protein